jgi:RNA polymerase sigma factor (sigma-70 family)
LLKDNIQYLDEFQLIKECLKGDPTSQKQLYDRFAPKMLGVCYRYAINREEAEDFLQEAFITVFKKLYQFKNQGALEAWVRRIVINTSLNHIKTRHQFLTEDIDKIEPETLPVTMASDEFNSLVELIRGLPDGYKTVFNLYAIEGYSHDEIAKLLGINASTSRSQYTRARKLLMEKLNTNPETRKMGKHG